jgi:hypothetical protein
MRHLSQGRVRVITDVPRSGAREQCGMKQSVVSRTVSLLWTVPAFDGGISSVRFMSELLQIGWVRAG